MTCARLTAALCVRHVQDLSGWMMTVVDAAGKAVFALGFNLKPRLVPGEFLAERRQGARATNVVRLG